MTWQHSWVEQSARLSRIALSDYAHAARLVPCAKIGCASAPGVANCTNRANPLHSAREAGPALAWSALLCLAFFHRFATPPGPAGAITPKPFGPRPVDRNSSIRTALGRRRGCQRATLLSPTTPQSVATTQPSCAARGARAGSRARRARLRFTRWIEASSLQHPAPSGCCTRASTNAAQRPFHSTHNYPEWSAPAANWRRRNTQFWHL